MKKPLLGSHRWLRPSPSKGNFVTHVACCATNTRQTIQEQPSYVKQYTALQAQKATYGKEKMESRRLDAVFSEHILILQQLQTKGLDNADMIGFHSPVARILNTDEIYAHLPRKIRQLPPDL